MPSISSDEGRTPDVTLLASTAETRTPLVHDSCCVECRASNAPNSFKCPDCEKTGDHPASFRVCGVKCQRSFWKKHKRAHAGKEREQQDAATEEPSIMRSLRMELAHPRGEEGKGNYYNSILDQMVADVEDGDPAYATKYVYLPKEGEVEKRSMQWLAFRRVDNCLDFEYGIYGDRTRWERMTEAERGELRVRRY